MTVGVDVTGTRHDMCEDVFEDQRTISDVLPHTPPH